MFRATLKLPTPPDRPKHRTACALLLALASLAFVRGAQYAKNKALCLAAMRGSADDVKAELSAGADVNGRSEDGISPLMYAAAFNTDPAVARALLEAGTIVGPKTP